MKGLASARSSVEREHCINFRIELVGIIAQKMTDIKRSAFKLINPGTLLQRPRKATLEACLLDLAQIMTLYLAA